MVACHRTVRKAAPIPSGTGPHDQARRASPPVAVVRFAPRVAPWVRERYEPAAITNLPDGSVDIRIAYDSQVFLAGWVLSFAGAATVIDPPAVRAEISRRLSRSFGRG